ncbi:hypothetical protein E2562_017363 [Oryza meyeriana var. granulata]|uniref:NB-ARC domain-containing protein n=1 Tax=Oryza meyeriana var. granulata TaxID=110450 RepID=A0A6G1D6M0_9ORYZ|nr:hypothetical protein E2562_017363 [Oryza meyeriana var. granulata]
MVKIFKDTLHQLGKDKYSDIYQQATWDEALHIIKLREFLRDKRYLVVIDDIWDTSAWERMKYSLSDNENGSRIIKTTRIRDVAEQVGVHEEIEAVEDALRKAVAMNPNNPSLKFNIKGQYAEQNVNS